MSTHYTARVALQRQLAIEWSFATDFVIDHIDLDLALWKPAPTSVTVHRTDDGWVADWPDDEHDDTPAPATIGWLLWHIEWWWANTLARVNGGQQVAPQDARWSGGTTRLVDLKAQWDAVLAGDDLDRPITWVTPEPQPLGHIAGWVNFELGKNLAEINQLAMLRRTLGQGFIQELL